MSSSGVSEIQELDSPKGESPRVLRLSLLPSGRLQREMWAASLVRIRKARGKLPGTLSLFLCLERNKQEELRKS